MITPAMVRDRKPEPDLFNSAAKTEAAQLTATDPRIDQMLQFLRGRGWTKREAVFQAIGVCDRVGRALKAASGGFVISDSQKGYCHLMDCTPDEFRHATNEIRSRVRELQSYMDEMEKVFSTERAA